MTAMAGHHDALDTDETMTPKRSKSEAVPDMTPSSKMTKPKKKSEAVSDMTPFSKILKPKNKSEAVSDMAPSSKMARPKKKKSLVEMIKTSSLTPINASEAAKRTARQLMHGWYLYR